MTHSFNPARRRLFGGNRADPVRPPWVVSERMLDLCTRCDACAAACSEGLIRPGDGGFPEMDFSAGECTFCRACAEACLAALRPASAETAIFDLTALKPWTVKASIGEGCLARGGVHCQTCRDVCPEMAVSFRLKIGLPPQPVLDDEVCNGCGACVSTCPSAAITVANS